MLVSCWAAWAFLIWPAVSYYTYTTSPRRLPRGLEQFSCSLRSSIPLTSLLKMSDNLSDADKVSYCYDGLGTGRTLLNTRFSYLLFRSATNGSQSLGPQQLYPLKAKRALQIQPLPVHRRLLRSIPLRITKSLRLRNRKLVEQTARLIPAQNSSSNSSNRKENG